MSLVGSAGMNMPLHQISVIPRDVTSSRVSGSGKAKDKDKQVHKELKATSDYTLRIMGWFYPIKYVIHLYVEFPLAMASAATGLSSFEYRRP